MSHREGNAFIIEPERSQQCDDCGRIAELRPYGPGGSVVCFDCAMKDPVGTEARFARFLAGTSEQPAPALCKCKHPRDHHVRLSGTFAHCRTRCGCGLYRPAPEATP